MPAMIATLRPITFKLLFIAAGVLLGLITIALMATPHAHASHGLIVDAAKMKPLGVLWH